MSFWGELRRRNVVKVGAAYLIVSWLIVQIISVLNDPLSLPDSLDTIVVVLLAVGFPFALLLAWAYEVTPQGLKLTSEIDRSESISRITGQRLNYVVTTLLALAVIFLVIDDYVLVDSDSEVVVQEVAAPSVDSSGESPSPVTAESAREVLANSVAVLPLQNLSPDPDNAFYAAGMHVEIINQLSKLRNLSVINRDSVLQYRENRPPVEQIASVLGVQSVLGGTFQYASGQIRVALQLVDPTTGTNLWADEYQDDFADIFAVQADIAMNVANTLQAEFSELEQARIERVPTDSIEAHALFLRAMSTQTYVERRRYFDRAIEADSEFAEAYAWRAYKDAFAFTNSGGAETDANLTSQARAALANSVLSDVDVALTLNPDLGLAYFARAVLHYAHWRWTEANEDINRAVDLSPNDAAILGDLGWLLGFFGRTDEGVMQGRRLVELSPESVPSHFSLGTAYINAGRPDVAAESLREAARLEPGGVAVLDLLNQAEIMLGNYAEARETLRLVERLEDNPSPWVAFRAYRYSIMGDDQEASRLFREFETWAASVDRVGEGDWAMAYLAVGDNEQALASLNRAVELVEAQESALSMFVLLRLTQNIFDDPVLEQPEFVDVRNRLRGE